ncbi:hypothetical protein FERRO_06060 [Ferrovum sp. JA12]|uniref:hypothetical protein n=1 Tax=Ferrovum sp. JA12 TaxID=1356299 RepID=UPI0007034E99|nr:hypothetical protein [Ferrovum sp. JA12]KRH79538.1 hypothetical protein FERRO_06060 [Ferrovum sp. JA12]
MQVKKREKVKKFKINEKVSEKIREFIGQRFATFSTRAKFKELESKSGISATKWQNFFYKKQEATQEIIKFWLENYSDDQLYSGGAPEYVEEFLIDKNVSVILRGLIVNTFKNRGRFSELEMKSGISAYSWKNFYYAKQEATQEMVGFWCSFKPESSALLLRSDSKPLSSTPLTLADRLNWVIRVYGPSDADYLFEYLSKKISNNNIPSEDWEKLFHKTIEPTLEMVIAICQWIPNFTEWIICGSVSSSQTNPQVTQAKKDAIKTKDS